MEWKGVQNPLVLFLDDDKGKGRWMVGMGEGFYQLSSSDSTKGHYIECRGMFVVNGQV